LTGALAGLLTGLLTGLLSGGLTLGVAAELLRDCVAPQPAKFGKTVAIAKTKNRILIIIDAKQSNPILKF
jgi:hypothetical protein